MVEPVRTTVLALIVVGFILCLSGIVTPSWGTGYMTKMDKDKGIIEHLVTNWQDQNIMHASIWNSHEWWPELSATGTQILAPGNLVEAKVTAVFTIIFGIISVAVHAIYTLKSDLNYNKIWAVFSGCLQITAGLFSGILCALMAGCLTNKMASNPLFRLGDSFIVTVIGTILFSVCGVFTLFHFVYSVKELALDKKLLLMYPEVEPAEQPAQYGAGMPSSEQFPTSVSIAPNLQSPSQEFAS